MRKNPLGLAGIVIFSSVGHFLAPDTNSVSAKESTETRRIEDNLSETSNDLIKCYKELIGLKDAAIEEQRAIIELQKEVIEIRKGIIKRQNYEIQQYRELGLSLLANSICDANIHLDSSKFKSERERIEYIKNRIEDAVQLSASSLGEGSDIIDVGLTATYDRVYNTNHLESWSEEEVLKLRQELAPGLSLFFNYAANLDFLNQYSEIIDTALVMKTNLASAYANFYGIDNLREKIMISRPFSANSCEELENIVNVVEKRQLSNK